MASAKTRYAIGLLNGLTPLRYALEELARAGVPPERSKVLVPTRLLEQALADWPASVRTLAGTWTVFRPSTEGTSPWQFELVGLDDGSEPAVNPGAEALQDFHRWALQRHAQRLDKHLRAGGAMLLVHLIGDEEEQSVCRVLLRHSAGGVQTHDLRFAGAEYGVAMS